MKCDECANRRGCIEYGWKPNECKMFEPIVQTNEEWLRTATREELAEWLHTAIFDDNFANKMADKAYMNMQTREDYIEKWLQEKHT